MTLSTTAARISHTGNGSSTAFAFPYKFLANSDLKVYVAGILKTLTTHYTVAGAGLAAGGTVTFATAPASGAVVMIVRDPPVTQTTAYSNNGPFPAASTETAFDKAAMIDQRSRDMISRSLRLAEGDVDGSGAYAANNNRIGNVGPGVVAGDVVTIDQITALATGTAVEFYSTKAVAEAATIESAVTWLRTQGYTDVGDGGGALYNKVVSEPAHVGKFQSQDGAWWELAETTVSIKMLGAVGDDATDNTAAFQAVVDIGLSEIVVPAGTYLTDEITFADPITITLSTGAVIKRRSEASDALWKFIGTDQTVIGGTFDGNRDNVGVGWPGAQSLIQAEGTRFTLRDAHFINNDSFPVWIASGSQHYVDNISVDNCSNAVLFQYVTDSVLGSCTATNINNDGLDNYSVVFDCRELDRCKIGPLRVNGFTPDSDIDPFPAYYSFERVNNSQVAGLFGNGYAGFEPRNFGMVVSGCRGTRFDSISLRNIFRGIQILTNFNVTIDSFLIDGNYTRSVLSDGYGIWVTSQGVYQNTGEDTTFDYLATATNRNLIITNGVVRACDNGILDESGKTTFRNVHVNGNLRHGWLIQDCVLAGRITQRNEDSELIDCEARFNGFNGIFGLAANRLSIQGGAFCDNGYDDSIGDSFQTGIYLSELAGGELKRIRVYDAFCGDTQDWTKTAGASFKPGSTVNDEYEVTLLDSYGIHVGQKIKLVGATTGGDVVGRVVLMNLDVATLRFDTSKTFTDSGNTTSLTGTMTASSGAVTGSGTAFTTELIPGQWIKHGSDYFVVVRIASDTSMVIWPSNSFASGSASKIAVDIEGIPSQHFGLFANTVTGPLMVRDIDTDGALTASHYLANNSSLLTGQEIVSRDGVLSSEDA